MRDSVLLRLAGLMIAGLAMVDPAFAQDGSILTDLENQVASASQGWQDTVVNAATSLFWILAGIEVGIAAIWLAIQAPAAPGLPLTQ